MNEASVKTVADPRSGASVRALPGGYLAASLVLTFVSSLLVYLDQGLAAAAFAVSAWIVAPALWLTDRIVFDGRRIGRTGMVFRLVARTLGVRDRLKLNDIEQVETSVFPGIKRGKNVLYTYRTSVSGKSAHFVFSSGHRGYHRVIRALLPKLPEGVMDLNSIDLRDHLVERAEVARRAKALDIPSSEVLDSSFRNIELRGKTETISATEAAARSEGLRSVANELRVSGRLLSALEAFRRAAVLQPRDARLLVEFAACIRSAAGSESDARLEHKALAMLRLAERHASNDRDLLERIAETYYQIGEWRRSALVFRRAVEKFGESFRALRGMAELALREGKLAHVVHNFAAAYRLAETSAVRRWTKAEADYFEHLNNDDEYMELEISRVNLLDTLERIKRSVLRIAVFGFGVIVAGLLVEDYLIANIGWAVSGLSLTVWITAIVMVKMLSDRIPFELVEDDD